MFGQAACFPPKAEMQRFFSIPLFGARAYLNFPELCAARSRISKQRYSEPDMKKIFFLIFLAALLAFCQKTEKKPAQTLQLYARYLAPEAQIRVEATLESRESGAAPQKTEIPGGIRYNDYPLTAVNAQGPLYLFQRSWVYTPDHVFSWRTPEGQTRKFEARVPAFDSLQFDQAVLQRDAPARFAWKGEPLGRGEALTFIWEKIGGGKTAKMEIVSVSPEPSVEFPAAKIAELEPGRWALYVIRRQLLKSEAEGLPVSAIFEYYSQADTLLIQ